MCDTFWVPVCEPIFTWFAKNSDRSPNEPQLLLRVPQRRHAPNTSVRCTYIAIPQVEYTREMILSKPSWMWGAEMGVNADGVAIGNEAVFTKSKTKKAPPALLGMDLLRLALERASTAADAIEVMIALLEQYGQGGNCGFDHDFRYDNSFLAADADEAYILETSGKRWAVKRAEGACAISNRLTIAKEHTRRAGFDEDADFAQRFTEPVFSHFSRAKQRRCQVTEQLTAQPDAAQLMQILRTHPPALAGKEFTRAAVGSVCMHAGGVIGDHTTSSFVVALRKNKPVTIWCTGASTPCISAFKPVFFGSASAPLFTEEAPALDYWLQREKLHRAVIAGIVDIEALREQIHLLEQAWIQTEQFIFKQTPDEQKLQALSAHAAKAEQAMIDAFLPDGWQNVKGRSSYARYWRRKNAALGAERKGG